MCHHVIFQVVRPRERLSANSTLEWLQPGVDPHVSAEICSPCHHFVAHRARERHPLVDDLLMFGERLLPFEPFSAE
jgi:hypothetical protein